MAGRHALPLRLSLVALAVLAFPAHHAAFAAPPSALEQMRRDGDGTAQRAHVWSVIAALTQVQSGKPQFESWHGEDAVFADFHAARGITGFSRSGERPAFSSDVPVITYTLFNDAAFDHINHYRLNSTTGLETLRKDGPPDSAVAGDRDVPPFPSASVVLKTVWWPVAKTGLTALPVWDPQNNPPRKNGNPYTSWRRVVAVDPHARQDDARTVPIEFAGSRFAAARRVGLDTFHHVPVSAALARRMMRDPESRKAAIIALGRPLRAGDHLLLVAANLATREVPDWIWATFWWHDRADQGPFAAGRPAGLTSVWRNYLMQAAFDAASPAAKDGGPHICFDPWLEGRFPDAGHGGGSASNCMACHSRASYPAVPFLPVTRGLPDLKHDPAFAPGRLRTSLLWSLAMHAKP